jgi:hypothetical protein
MQFERPVRVERPERGAHEIDHLVLGLGVFEVVFEVALDRPTP